MEAIIKITDKKGDGFRDKFNVDVLPQDNGKNNLLESLMVYIKEEKIDLENVKKIIITNAPFMPSKKAKTLMTIIF